MKSLIFILLLGGLSYHFSDMRSGGLVQSLLLPALVGVAVLALVHWLKTHLNGQGNSDSAETSFESGHSSSRGCDRGDSSSDSGGGDCGGGDGGGGGD